MNTTEAKKNMIEVFENCSYSYLSRLFDHWKYRVYFTEGGKARLGAVVGYIIGLKHAGQEELAEKMAQDIHDKLSQLSLSHNDFVVERTLRTTVGEDGKQVSKEVEVRVPMQKCVVSDDGTWHGFGLNWFRLLAPETYEETLKKHQADISAEREAGKEVYETAHWRTVKQLRILERIDPNAAYSEELTEYRFLEKGQTKFYYVPGFNGGLIYHGPGAGQTFTVNIGGGCLWGIHT
jgi:hypothetical protein